MPQRIQWRKTLLAPSTFPLSEPQSVVVWILGSIVLLSVSCSPPLPSPRSFKMIAKHRAGVVNRTRGKMASLISIVSIGPNSRAGDFQRCMGAWVVETRQMCPYIPRIFWKRSTLLSHSKDTTPLPLSSLTAAPPSVRLQSPVTPALTAPDGTVCSPPSTRSVRHLLTRLRSGYRSHGHIFSREGQLFSSRGWHDGKFHPQNSHPA